jgi:hypothetical protein
MRPREGMIEGTIFKIKKYALHDGPGIRTTVFFKGCPLLCRWCHNPEGLDPQPQTMLRRTSSGKIDETVGTRIGVDALIKEIEKDVLFYDESGGGVTFSGGEPLAQPQFLEALLAACNPAGNPCRVGHQRFCACGGARSDPAPVCSWCSSISRSWMRNSIRKYTGVSNANDSREPEADR